MQPQPSSSVPTEAAPPLAQLAERDASRVGSVWKLAVVTAAIANILAMLVLASGTIVEGIGARNETPPFLMSGSEAMLMLLWLASGIALIMGATIGRGTSRFVARGAMLVCAAALPVSCSNRPLPHESYTRGLVRWTATHVDAEAIRQWHASLMPATQPAPVPAAQWPPAITALTPTAVEQLPNGQGIALQWGVLASWGTSRKVFVAGGPDSAPPDDVHHFWMHVRSGVYAAFQDRN